MFPGVLRSIPFGFCVLLVGGILSCSGGDAPPESAEPADSQVTISTNEEILALFEQPGAAAVVANFWATWCVPCRKEMPELIRFYEQYSPRGVSFVSVSVDDPEDPGEDLLPFIEEVGIPFHVYVPGKDQAAGELIAALDENWGGGLPATFIFGPSGEIIEKWMGPVEFKDLAKAVDPLLKG